jgi:hypothetical protein
MKNKPPKKPSSEMRSDQRGNKKRVKGKEIPSQGKQRLKEELKLINYIFPSYRKIK